MRAASTVEDYLRLCLPLAGDVRKAALLAIEVGTRAKVMLAMDGHEQVASAHCLRSESLAETLEAARPCA